MKKLIALLLLTALVIVITISPVGAFADKKIQLALSPCDTPITYRIDEVDPQFNITKSVFTQRVKEAADLWNTASEKEIFRYDPNGTVSINLTFDGRQAITEEINSLENNVTSEKGDLDTRRSEYDKRGAAFEGRVQKLNEDVAYWNSQGGAPENEYNKMIEEQNALRAEASILNEMAQSLNESTNEFNTDIRELNQSIDTFNSALQQKPEEGIYSEGGLRIDIYFNTNTNTLIRTIAHELGHARGLDHVPNESAVMYEKTFPEYILTSEDLAELSRACRKRTPSEAASETFRNFILDLKRKNA